MTNMCYLNTLTDNSFKRNDDSWKCFIYCDTTLLIYSFVASRQTVWVGKQVMVGFYDGKWHCWGGWKELLMVDKQVSAVKNKTLLYLGVTPRSICIKFIKIFRPYQGVRGP